MKKNRSKVPLLLITIVGLSSLSIVFALTHASNAAPAVALQPCQGKPSRPFGTPIVVEDRRPAGRDAQLWTTEIERQHGAGRSDVQLSQSLRQRFQYLLNAMDLAPEQALRAVLAPDVRQAIADTAAGCLETEVTLEGRLEIIHFDFIDGRTEDRFGLRTADQTLYSLHPAGQLRTDLLSNMYVRIRGFRLDHEIVFDGRNSVDAPSGFDVIEIPTNPPVVGDQPTAVILFNFQDTVQPNITAQQTKDLVYGQVSDLYEEMSDQRIRLIGSVDPLGDVFGWYQVSMNTTCSDIGGALNAAMAAANADVDFTQYSRLIIAAPFRENNSSCGWGGSATIDRVNVTTPDGPVLMSVTWSGTINLINVYNIGHELGHNFSNRHARFINCGNVSWADSGCSELEYGDRYDVMGSGPVGHFNAPHKEQVGWFAEDELVNVTASETYTITPMSSFDPGIKALKIPRGPGLSLYVEYRQPIGFDSNLNSSLTSDIYTGVLLHSALNTKISYPYLLDATPPGDRMTPVLAPGAPWIDPQTGTTLTVLSLSPTEAVVNINLVINRDITPPQITLTGPRPNATIGGEYVMSAEATDNVGVVQVEFYMDGFTPPMVIDATAPYSGIVNSYWFQGTHHFFRAEAIDAAGNVAVSAVHDVLFDNTPVTPPGGVDTTAPASVTDIEAP